VEVAEAARDAGRAAVPRRAGVEADDARAAAQQRVGRGEADDPRADDGDIDLRRRGHRRRNPPSAWTTWPVTHPASSEHRNATSAAASSRRRTRALGDLGK